MRAVAIDHSKPQGLAFAEVDTPSPGYDEAIVEVEMFALNPGELATRTHRSDGDRIGWDFVGTVREAAESGEGPPVGAAVAGSVPDGAWAERIAVPVRNIAVLPDGLEPRDAVCACVPAMTAYVALAEGGLLFGKRVLVTGAAGAVGQFACQIASASNARISAAVRRDEQVEIVRAHDVRDVRVTEGIDAFEGEVFDLIVDVVGQGVTHEAMSCLAPYGTYVLLSMAGGGDLDVPFVPLQSANGRIQAIDLFTHIDAGSDTVSTVLGRILGMVDSGVITAPVGDVHPWTELDSVIDRYLSSARRDKPILSITEHAYSNGASS